MSGLATLPGFVREGAPRRAISVADGAIRAACEGVAPLAATCVAEADSADWRRGPVRWIPP